MACELNGGCIKFIKQITLVLITAYLYTTFSLLVPSCGMVMASWKIFPFDKNFISSSVLFMASAAITIVNYDVWPQNTKPKNILLKFLGEVLNIH